MTVFLYKKIAEEINRADHILLLTDERIDGDTIGATLGMYHVLKEMGKEVEVFSPRPLDGRLAFLPGVEVIQRDSVLFEETHFDLAMIFDCADGKYIEEYRNTLKSIPLIVFDHHDSNKGYGALNLIEPDSASAAEVVWRFVKNAHLPMNRPAAQCFLAGIVTDTDVFSTSNTNIPALEAAPDLSRLGAKLQEIIRETIMNRSVSTLKLWGLAFERLHKNPEFGAIATAITQKDLFDVGACEDDVHKLSNFLNAMLEGYEVVLVLYEMKEGSVKGSLRSQTQDVAKMAEKYGGGGHIRAAGFKIPNVSLVLENGVWLWKSRV
jgi:phosphoesterase RecJ-like protein